MRRSLPGIAATVALAISLIILNRPARADDLTAQEALSAFEAAAKSIDSYDVRCKVNWEWQLQTIVTGKRKVNGRVGVILQWTPYGPNDKRDVMTRFYRQVRLADGHRRIDESDSSGKLDTAGVYDGQVAEHYFTRSSSASITGHPPAFVRDGDDYSTYVDNASGVYPYVSLFRSRPELRLVSDNPLPHTIELDSPPNTGAGWYETGFRLWLDLDHGLLPRRIERYEHTAEELADRSEVTKYYQLPSGVWVPVAAHVTFFVRGKGRPFYGKPAIEVAMDVDVAHSKWNESVPDDAFQLPIPTGTKVVDLTRKIAFTTGASDPGTNIDDLVKHARNVIQFSRGQTVALSAGGSSTYAWLLALNGGVVLLLAILIVLKRRRRLAL